MLELEGGAVCGETKTQSHSPRSYPDETYQYENNMCLRTLIAKCANRSGVNESADLTSLELRLKRFVFLPTGPQSANGSRVQPHADGPADPAVSTSTAAQTWQGQCETAEAPEEKRQEEGRCSGLAAGHAFPLKSLPSERSQP